MATFLVDLIVSILKAFLPSLKEASKDTHTVAVPEDEGLEKRLRDKVKSHWGVSTLLLCSLLMFGCGTRTVYIPDGTPVKLRESLKGVKVWVKTKEGEIIATEMDVSEGWFILPDTPEK